MDKIIKGFPFWHDIVNDNFTEMENNIDNITKITNENTTQLSENTQQIEKLNLVSQPHKLTYKTVSTTVGQEDSNGNPTLKPSISDWTHIKTQGADAVLVVMVGVTTVTDSNPIMIDDSLFNSAISDANNIGVKIDMIKLHIGLHYSDGFNRSDYLPDNIDTYFSNWKTICLHYAKLCNDNNIPILCIGCEQTNQSVNSYLSYWTSIVTAIKTQYPNLLITYAPKTWEISNANNQDICSVLDFIGYNVYLNYTQNALSVVSPTIDNLAKAFYNDVQGNTVIPTIIQLANKYNKKIFITEIGCMPVDKGLITTVPYDYVSNGTVYDSVAWLMKVAFNVLFRNTYVIGFSWWHTASPFTYYNDSGITSAEQVMIDYVKGGLI